MSRPWTGRHGAEPQRRSHEESLGGREALEALTRVCFPAVVQKLPLARVMRRQKCRTRWTAARNRSGDAGAHDGTTFARPLTMTAETAGAPRLMDRVRDAIRVRHYKSPDGAELRHVDPSVHRPSWEAPSIRAWDRPCLGVSLRPGDEREGRRVHAEPGTQCGAVHVSHGSADGRWPG